MSTHRKGSPSKRIQRRITANGTFNEPVGFPIRMMALTVKGVGAAPTAWKVEVKGRPWAQDTDDVDDAATVVIDDHTNGVEADGACVQSTATGVLSDIDIVMSTLNLGSATGVDVEIVLLGY